MSEEIRIPEAVKLPEAELTQTDAEDDGERPQRDRMSDQMLRARGSAYRGLGSVGASLFGKPENAVQRSKNKLADLFETPQPEDNDIYTDDLFTVDSQDFELNTDISDLTRVSSDNIIGRPRSRRRQMFRRTEKPYNPPTSIGGVG